MGDDLKPCLGCVAWEDECTSNTPCPNPCCPACAEKDAEIAALREALSDLIDAIDLDVVAAALQKARAVLAGEEG